MSQKKLRPPFKVKGSRHYLSAWVVEHFPENYRELDYVEPFAGVASVLLTKDRPVGERIEALNESELGIVQILRALRDEPDNFLQKLKGLSYSERSFKRELEKTTFEDYLDHAVRDFVVRRMSKDGEMKVFTGRSAEAKTWAAIVDDLHAVSARMKGVRLLNKPSTEVIRSFSDENALCYCDPPTWEDNESSIRVHHELWQILNSFAGKVLICGKSNSLYNRLYKGWNKVQNKDGRKAKPDVLWMNY